MKEQETTKSPAKKPRMKIRFVFGCGYLLSVEALCWVLKGKERELPGKTRIYYLYVGYKNNSVKLYFDAEATHDGFFGDLIEALEANELCVEE